MMNNNTSSSTGFFKNFKNVSIEDDEKVTSRGRPEDVPKRRHIDVPMWSSMQYVKRYPLCPRHTSYSDVLRTLKYDVLKTSQCNVLRTFPYCSICNTKGRPYRNLEDVFIRRYEDVPTWSNM